MRCPKCLTFMENVSDTKDTRGIPPMPKTSDFHCAKCPRDWRLDREGRVLIPLGPTVPSQHRRPHVEWKSLSHEGQERLLHLVPSLSEFHAGYRIYVDVMNEKSAMHPAFRFMHGVINAALYGYYCDQPNHNGVLPILHLIGRPDLAMSITKLLDRRVGEKTVRQRIADHRHRFNSHLRFTSAGMKEGLSMTEGADHKGAADCFRYICWKTVKLHGYLRNTYPETDSLIRHIANLELEESPSVDNPPSPAT